MYALLHVGIFAIVHKQKGSFVIVNLLGRGHLWPGMKKPGERYDIETEHALLSGIPCGILGCACVLWLI